MNEIRDVFVLKNIRASRVNLIMNDFAAGLPSPLSFLGLADTIMRKLDLEPWAGRSIPILHNVSVSEGRTKPEMEIKSKSFAPIETIEDMIGTVDLSLIMHLPGCESETSLRKNINGLRIAGGIIQNDTIDIAAVTADGSCFHGLRRGYAMVRPEGQDRLQITTGDTSEEQEGLAALAKVIFPKERLPGHGFIVPASVGYHLIEDPDTAPKRIRTRSNSIPHVYAEPVVGISELISIRNARLTELDPAGLDRLFWAWSSKGTYVLGHSDYHPL